MAGEPRIPTAPKDVIGDDGDLRQMRDALRDGKHVTLASDGKVYISNDAGPPMTEQQEGFIESKLGHVVELARSGYGVSVHADGTISAHRADQRSIVLYDPDPQLSEQQRLLIERAIQEGAQVRVHSDGRVEYAKFENSVPPTGEQAAEMRAAIESEISSGRLLTAMQGGESLSVNPDGSVGYVRVGPGPEPVLFPEERIVLDTVEEFEAEAEALELGGSVARTHAHDDLLHDQREATTKRDQAGRDRAAAEGTAAEADRQAAAARQRANELDRAEVDSRNKAAAARQAGDEAGVREATEHAQGLHTMLIAARLEAESAGEAAATSRAAAVRHAEQEQRFDTDVTAARRRAKEMEDIVDRQEDQANEYRTAAAELREAERLEAALPDLEARGVTGVERVKEAATEHRRLAAEAADRGRAYDQAVVPEIEPVPTGPTAPTGPVTLPPPIHGDFDSAVGDDIGGFVEAEDGDVAATDVGIAEFTDPPTEPFTDISNDAAFDAAFTDTFAEVFTEPDSFFEPEPQPDAALEPTDASGDLGEFA